MIDFTQPNEHQYWTAVNDNVMGGISTGQFTYDGSVSQFTGELSLDNNGGFSSVNRSVSPLTNNINAVNLSYIGDGRTYQLRFSTWKDGYRINYKHEFETIKGQKQSKTFYFKEFKAVFRGRLLSGAPELDAQDIKQVGFLIADKQPLPFTLNLIHIQFETSQ
ncbi:CIA30 family protein [Photobacterium sp. Ph6]|uniref:CIA30 family protein n=1 Tax=unclassified Photobacterium TaxID=2628852 RepID=UPI0031F8EA14|nr:CIA30 family protein [Photobacterium sp. Ph6]MCG3875217.1 CIA30 family protein [Photobacterium sp. Ph5]